MADQPASDFAFAPDFHIGDWLVEPSLDRLSRNGTSVRLRPQLTDLLVLLARRAGRTVSKGEILEGVWGRLFVGESGVSRCISELRHALEDDARKPVFLETITKRGYRVVAPVVFVEIARGPADAATAPDAPGDAGGAAARETAYDAANETRRCKTEPTPLARAAPAPDRRPVRWALAWGASVAALLAPAWARRPRSAPGDGERLIDLKLRTSAGRT